MQRWTSGQTTTGTSMDDIQADAVDTPASLRGASGRQSIARCLFLSTLHAANLAANFGVVAVLLAAGQLLPLAGLLSTALALSGLVCCRATWLEFRPTAWTCRSAVAMPIALVFCGCLQLIQLILLYREIFGFIQLCARSVSGGLPPSGALLASPRSGSTDWGAAASAPLVPGALSEPEPPSPRRTVVRRAFVSTKGLEGVIEGSCFAGGLFVLLTRYNEEQLRVLLWPTAGVGVYALIWMSAGLSLLTACTSIVEVDRGASVGMVRFAKRRPAWNLAQLALRSSEVGLRLWVLCSIPLLAELLDPDSGSRNHPRGDGASTTIPPMEPIRVAKDAVIVILLASEFVVSFLVLFFYDRLSLLALFVALPSMVCCPAHFADTPQVSSVAKKVFRLHTIKNLLEALILIIVLIVVFSGLSTTYAFSPNGINAALEDGGVTTAGLALFWAGAACFPVYLGLFVLAMRLLGIRADTLHRAAKRGDTQALNRLLSGEDGYPGHTSVNLTNRHGKTPLHMAALANSEGAVELLLKYGANLETGTDPVVNRDGQALPGCEGGETALMLAAKEGNAEAVKALLRYGGGKSINAVNPAGDTALHLAARGGYSSCVVTLLSCKANLYTRNRRGETPDMILQGKSLCDGAGEALDAVRAHGRSSKAESSDGEEEESKAGGAAGKSDLAGASTVEPSVAATPLQTGAESLGHSRAWSGGASSWEAPSWGPPAAAAVEETHELHTVEYVAEDEFMKMFEGAHLDESMPGSIWSSKAQSESVASDSWSPFGRLSSSLLGPSRDSSPRNRRAAATDRRVALMAVREVGLCECLAAAGAGALRRAMRGDGAKADPLALPLDSSARLRRVPGKLSWNNFQIVRVIGQGQFGKVYEVVDLRDAIAFHRGEDQPRAALKVLNKKQYKDLHMKQQAKQERKVLKTAKHPFVVRMLGAFRTDLNQLALVMELCPNGNLNDFVVRHGRPGIEEVLARKMLAQVVLALEYLHDVINVVFRDLKPDNIVLDRNMAAKLTDFGLSKPDATKSMLQESFVGSDRYLPPEVFGDLGGVTSVQYSGRAMDLYALGLVAWICLTGGETISDAQDVPLLPTSPAEPSGDAKETRAPPISHRDLWLFLAARRRIIEHGHGARDPYEIAAMAAGLWSEEALSFMELLCSPRHPCVAPEDERMPAIHEMEQSVKEAELRGTARELKEHVFFSRFGCEMSAQMQPPLANADDWTKMLPCDDSYGEHSNVDSERGHSSWSTSGSHL